MNTKTLKGIRATVALLAGMGAASPALATSTGLQTFASVSGSSFRILDVWNFACPVFAINPVIYARARVFDAGSLNPLVYLTVILGEDGAPTVQVTDQSPLLGIIPIGDSSGPSAWAVVADGPGTYAMGFLQTGPGLSMFLIPESYVGEAECIRANQAVFHPTLIQRINS